MYSKRTIAQFEQDNKELKENALNKIHTKTKALTQLKDARAGKKKKFLDQSKQDESGPDSLNVSNLTDNPTYI